MGEMIKFGIKIGLVVATGLAICAALFILFSMLGNFVIAPSQSWFLTEIFRLFSLLFPLDLSVIFVTIGALFGFKVAYWAADKMIVLIDALG